MSRIEICAQTHKFGCLIYSFVYTPGLVLSVGLSVYLSSDVYVCLWLRLSLHFIIITIWANCDCAQTKPYTCTIYRLWYGEKNEKKNTRSKLEINAINQYHYTNASIVILYVLCTCCSHTHWHTWNPKKYEWLWNLREKKSRTMQVTDTNRRKKL